MYSLENYICSCRDIRSEILSNLSSKNINMLLSTNKRMYEIKSKVIFYTRVKLTKKLCELKYFDSFTDIISYDGNYKLPKNITSLSFDKNFDKEIGPDTIPSTVTFLNLQCKYPVCSGYIPKSVTQLFLTVNQTITSGIIPDSVKELYFYGDNFFIDVGSIPESVTKLKFSRYFDKPILLGLIPKSVTDLNLSYNLNQKIMPGAIPPSVKKLYLESYYYTIKPGDIPFGVDRLKLVYNEKLIPGLIPNSVTRLKFGSDYNEKLIPGLIPNSVMHLKFGINYNKKIMSNALPTNLTRLTFGDRFNKKIKSNILPDSIQYLFLGKDYDHLIEYFPQSLIYLSLGIKYFHNIHAPVSTLCLSMTSIPKNYVPKSVTKLILKPTVTHLDDNSIPPNVSYLKIMSSKINIFGFASNISDNLYKLKIHPKIIVPDNIRKNILIKYFGSYVDS